MHNLFSLYAVNFSDHVTAFTKEKYGLILIYTESRCKKESNILKLEWSKLNMCMLILITYQLIVTRY